jgi:hypothetical protein
MGEVNYEHPIIYFLKQAFNYLYEVHQASSSMLVRIAALYFGNAFNMDTCRRMQSTGPTFVDCQKPVTKIIATSRLANKA